MKINMLTPDTEGNLAWPAFNRNRKSIVAVGNFDGVHRGHAAVLKRTVDLAKSYGATSVAIIFDPRPEVVHRYAKAHDGAQLPADETYADPDALTGIEQRLRLIEGYGIDRVIVVRYTLEFGAKSYQYFIGQLVGRIGMRTLVLGTDAHMGRNRAGDVKSIATLADATRVFELDVVDDRGPGERRVPLRNTPEAAEALDRVNDPDSGLTKAERRALSKKTPNRLVRAWSSTYVRYLLGRGRAAQAAEILGRPHAVEGTVVSGKQRGRTLGFPTANVGENVQGYMPADAVYAGWLVDLGAEPNDLPNPESEGESNAESNAAAETERTGKRYPAAISIGTKVTFGEPEERILEAYAIVDGEKDGLETAAAGGIGEALDPQSAGWIDLYGHRVRVEFLEYLRPQIHFDGPQALVDELKRNVAETLKICNASE
ncbi:bifunctional riboflavin kinase/FMN adenylyltransferase [Bifidobacterium margollesii]|uniref:Bifunctional riboflavin kinase/FMN adenylyltransferase n=1 Tax=Bifidobacterium margollesii TaxID=2020964 RepID=A0A2N5JAQ5_9BIFI|nr:riboflavin kinase [Bifidobacterium margollesii]PLS31290.1 bifunctional riboflavin kinase/FMN adenylyltransferase [Bifidobacterium margollesii]